MNTLTQLYREMSRIRRIEEEIARIYPSDKIKSPVHLSIGQEAVAAGVCCALKARDTVFGTYRSHAVYIAKGGDLKAMFAELYGKATGCAGGKGGSMHLIDQAHGIMGTSAIVATTIPLAVGYAYAHDLRRDGAVTVTFFGDGATEEGVFHESLNLAALKSVPVLFVCENNHYAVYSPFGVRQAKDNIWERAACYGMPAERLDGNDVWRVYEATQRALAHVRSGRGPYFLEIDTYRWKEHVGPNEDFNLGYRSREEAARWFATDPITVLGEQIPARERERIHAEITAEIAEAVAFAEASPFPEPGALFSDVVKEA